MIIEVYNQWVESDDFSVLLFMVHNCGNDWGFDVFLLGFGFSIRFQT